MKEFVRKISERKSVLKVGILIFLAVGVSLIWKYQSDKTISAQQATCGYQYQVCKDGTCIYATDYQFYRGCIYIKHPSDGNKTDKLCGDYQIKNNPFYDPGSADSDLCYCPIYGC